MIYQWTFKLFPCIYYCKYCFRERGSADFSSRYWIFSFGYLLRSGVAGSYDSSIFSFLKDFHTVFHSSCTNLHFFWQFTQVLFSPHSYPHLFISCLFDDSYSKRDEVIYHCGLICIYLMIIDAEHFFLSAICISSLEKFLFNSSAHF